MVDCFLPAQADVASATGATAAQLLSSAAHPSTESIDGDNPDRSYTANHDADTNSMAAFGGGGNPSPSRHPNNSISGGGFATPDPNANRNPNLSPPAIDAIGGVKGARGRSAPDLSPASSSFAPAMLDHDTVDAEPPGPQVGGRDMRGGG